LNTPVFWLNWLNHNKMKKERFRRPCKDCGKRFKPIGKFCYFCNECLKKKKVKQTVELRKKLLLRKKRGH